MGIIKSRKIVIFNKEIGDCVSFEDDGGMITVSVWPYAKANEKNTKSLFFQISDDDKKQLFKFLLED